ncbi:MAG TPA: hypothetical protein VKR38_14600 [Usitatibacter sp.]|nr:hypothetical protein [Usitatibacter sp.]
MKRLRIFAAIAAATALPALAGQHRGDPTFDYAFSFDVDDMVADAQSAQKEGEQWREYGERMREWAEQFSSDLQGSLALTFSDRVGRGKVVKGAPYSADVVSETNKTLSDGNVISHKRVNKVYRDGEGRTRQETYRDGELRSVYISDPVAGVSYTVLPKNKVAVKTTKGSTPRPEGASGEIRVDRNKQVIIVDNDGQPGAREEVRVRVISSDEDLPAPPVPPVPPVPAVPPVPPAPDFDFQMTPMPGIPSMHFESTAHLGRGVTTKLAAKEIEGVKAEGTQTLWTIPAGQIGNRAPINVTRETWTSPDLQVTLMSRYNDPRSGESIYKLAGIKRAEPSPDLFKVPEGFTVKTRSHTPMAAPPAPPAPPAPGAPAPRARG